MLTKEEIPHNFPSPHTDSLEQFIDYHVPLEKYTDLARFDGSVMIERTKGEISARCGGTSMNFVAINLANDIITGKRSVEEVRKEYTRLYQAYKQGENQRIGNSFSLRWQRERRVILMCLPCKMGQYIES